MTLSRLAALDKQIRDAGVPIDGVSRSPAGVVRIDFRPTATAPQQALAASLAAAFDFTPRRPRMHTALMTDIAALSSADRNTLLHAVLADFLRNHPTFAAQFGLSLVGDEVVP